MGKLSYPRQPLKMLTYRTVGISTYGTDLTRETDVGMRRHIAPDGGGQLGLVVTPPQLLNLHPTPTILPATFSALQHTTLNNKATY
jgi:hypothetical protein